MGSQSKAYSFSQLPSINLTYNSRFFEACKPLHYPHSFSDSCPGLELTRGGV